MDHTDKQITRFVNQIRGRLREQCIIRSLFCAVCMGTGIAIVIFLLALLIPFYHAPIAAGVVLAVAFVTGILVGIVKTPDRQTAALLADAKGYQERITTAFSMRGRQDPFSVLQRQDALKVIRSFSIKKQFPIRVSLKHCGTLSAMLVLLVAVSLVDTPAKQRAVERHMVKQDAVEEIARLEKVEKQIQDQKEITDAEAKEVTKQLESAKKELKDADSLKELAKAKEQLRKKMEIASQKTENPSLKNTLQDAVAQANEQQKKDQEKLAREADDALEKAKNGTEKEKQLAYEKLSQLAQELSDEELQQAAEQYQQSQASEISTAAAKTALQNAVDNRNDRQMLADNTSSATSDQQATQSNGNSQSNSGKQGSKQSQDANGNSSQNGAENGQQSGQGSNRKNGNSKGSGSGSGSGWNRGGKEGSEGAAKTAENVTIPDGELGQDGNLTGKANDNQSSTKQKSDQANAWSGNKVSYGKVSAEYKKKAYQKIEGSNYPGRMKEKIKNYFDGLN